jgi:hypothetical protein
MSLSSWRRAWLVAGTCAAAVATSAVAEERRDPVEQLVLKRIGSPAAVCGRFGNKPTATEGDALRTCITDAWRGRHAFFFSIGWFSIDSYTATGLMAGRSGEVKRFWYDSAPCGGPGCDARFDVSATCVVPTAAAAQLDPYLECPRKR